MSDDLAAPRRQRVSASRYMGSEDHLARDSLQTAIFLECVQIPERRCVYPCSDIVLR